MSFINTTVLLLYNNKKEAIHSLFHPSIHPLSFFTNFPRQKCHLHVGGKRRVRTTTPIME
jgi:hypothetical protein